MRGVYHLGSMERQIDAWLLDFDGTLYHSGPVKRAMALQLLTSGWFVLPTLRRFRKEHERLRQTLDETVADPFVLQLERTAEALGVDVSRVTAVVDEWMFTRPQATIARCVRSDLILRINEFQASGGKLAIVSDYPARKKLSAVSGLPKIEVIVASGEPGGPGRLKPHPDGYLKAARALNVETDRCLVIGDRQDADGEAAKRAGMAFELVS